MSIEDINDLIKEAKEKQKAFDEATVKCGIIGLSGSGKSSLINAIAGERIAPVGSTEQTMEAQSFLHAGIEFVDLPGCGTEKWPQSTYIQDLELEEYDCFIIVTSNRLYESDIYLHDEMATKRTKPCFIVRNKIDIAIQDEQHDNDLTENETILKVTNNIIESISSLNKGSIYLTSARQPTKWDFPKLLGDISDSQEGVKQEKFIAGMAVWSKEAIEKKRKIGLKIVSWFAVTSAANGLNPVPGLDVAVDAGVLLSMVKKINEIFGLTEEQLSYIEKTTPGITDTPEFNGIKQGIIKFIAKYAAVEGILIVLRRMGTKVVIKNTTKFLPFVGQLVSAGIGYKMTTSFGETYLDEAAEKSELLLLEVLSNG
ncbi:GTPase [Oceanobacter antarcticus]|uniref:GTPase n=1 Tax=Oceanobacter antarcticus TaxID=3133425 RepID=A0ABW8NCW1_9GAMM